MPELPEVETVRRGIKDAVTEQPVTQVIIRNHSLRWPIPTDLPTTLQGKQFIDVHRRGKYLLLETGHGHLLIHLGMSGQLCLVQPNVAIKKHDHVDIIFNNHSILRYNDARRFGCILWLDEDPLTHPLLKHLGPEPLSAQFNGAHLYKASRKRSTPVKSFIMDADMVVGVGNIYANEALYLARIHPLRHAHTLTQPECHILYRTIINVLGAAIIQGGTTLKDYVNSKGEPGYFKQELKVYGRKNQPCLNCRTPLQEVRLSNRSTVFCATCQI